MNKIINKKIIFIVFLLIIFIIFIFTTLFPSDLAFYSEYWGTTVCKGIKIEKDNTKRCIGFLWYNFE